MDASQKSSASESCIDLAPVTELERYGNLIAAELAGAEVELTSGHSRPFGGMSPEVMADVEQLRADQLRMFKSHVDIEKRHRVLRPGADREEVRHISFSSIAGSMREKENSTAQLLLQLEGFDRELRKVIGKFESSTQAAASPEDGVTPDPLHRRT